MSAQNLTQIVLNSHATIVEIPRGYGFEVAKKQIKIPASAEIIDFLSRIHDKQKTEIINADDILEIQAKMRGRNSKEQFVVLHDAEKMNEQAQNKFLKLLEEPRKNLHFILLTHSAESFLQTVRSRTQTTRITPISEFESLQILKKHKLDEAKTRQILFLAQGLPEELSKLASDKKYFNSKIEQIEMAKRWISGGNFEKLLIANSLKSDREKALGLIEQILRILRISTNQNSATKTIPEVRKLLQAYKKITNNGNARINLLAIILV